MAVIVETSLLGFMLFWCAGFALFGLFWRSETRFYRRLFHDANEAAHSAIALSERCLAYVQETTNDD